MILMGKITLKYKELTLMVKLEVLKDLNKNLELSPKDFKSEKGTPIMKVHQLHGCSSIKFGLKGEKGSTYVQ